MATLEAFLRKGELGPVRTGMLEADVVKILGSPEDESVAKEPKILKYGGLQLHFSRRSGGNDRVLHLIALYYGPAVHTLPALVAPQDVTFTASTNVDQFLEILNRLQLKRGATENIDDEEDMHFTVPSGVCAYFRNGTLVTLQYSAPSRQPAKKQISVSMSQETWDQLRTLAQQSSVSMAQLCAKWIHEHVEESRYAVSKSTG